MKGGLPHGVICCWRWKGLKRRGDEAWEFVEDEVWELVEAVPINEDGRPLTRPKNCGKDWSRWSVNDWLYEQPKDENDNDVTSIPGRVATIWTWEGGVRLMDVNPPGGASEWLTPFFSEKLSKMENWANVLLGGAALYFRTAEEARKAVESWRKVRS